MTYHQLIYTSRPNTAVTEEFLLEILEAAQAKNAELRVTGLLAFHEGNFIQLLEGKKEEVMNLYRSTERDPRHNDLQIELDAETELRAVPSWNMGFTSSKNFDSRIVEKPYFFPFDFVKNLAKMMHGTVDQKLLQLLGG